MVINETTRVTIRVRRYNPESVIGAKAYWQDWQIFAKPSDRILDALRHIKDDYDGSLTFRFSCGHGICGSDALRINGKNRLACQTLIKDLPTRKPITIEPLKGLPVLKDLVVDQEPFFAAYRDVLPFLIAEDNPTLERRQTPAQLDRYEDTTKCILCAACTTSCPVFWVDEKYFGPAAIVNAHRFIFDSRDGATGERLNILSGKHGVWRCRTAYNCTEACPRGIEVTKAIGEVKRAIIGEAI
jgi:succinate dehydrogenase / fumarate reductase iron-sulfur subunit